MERLPQTGTGVVWPSITPLMRWVATAICDFRKLPGCSNGGPLHCAIEDNNLDNSTLDWCSQQTLEGMRHYTSAFEGGPGWRHLTASEQELVADQTRVIVLVLSCLPEAERQVAVGMADRVVADYGDSYEQSMRWDELEHLRSP